jgi:hypothetical protein
MGRDNEAARRYRATCFVARSVEYREDTLPPARLASGPVALPPKPEVFCTDP